MELITVDDCRPHPDYSRKLEEGNILFFPKTPFELSDEEKEILRNTSQPGSGYHKNVAYRPAQDKVTGFDKTAVRDPEKLLSVLRAYSQQAVGFLRAFLPRYMERSHIDFASLRPQEEEGRSLPLKKRNDLLHVDAFPTRPTRGDLILRVFTNINPSQPRVWLTSDPFEHVARRYALPAGLLQIAGGASSPLGRIKRRFIRSMRAAGLTVSDRSPYDQFMLRFHDYLKQNQKYQQTCAKYRWEFPPGSTWMVFSDVVPHAVLSGRYALEQTVIVRRENLASSSNAPIHILERICDRPLAMPP